MASLSGQSISIWMNSPAPALPRLAADVEADVVVVGAGIAGMMTAYLLGREGKSVVVLDDGPIGGGETGRSTAHLSNAIDAGYHTIARLHGKHGARLTAESHTAAIDRIEQIAAEQGIDCDFERLDGYLFTPHGRSSQTLEHEIEAAHGAGLAAVEWVPHAPLTRFDTGPCLRFPRQGQIHPLKYLAGLAQAIVRDGGRLYTGAHVDKVSGGSPARVHASGGAIVIADAVVVATNTPVNDLLIIHTELAAYRSYVIGAPVPRGSVAKALYWDTEDPYHYVRLQSAPPAPDAGAAEPTEAYDVLIIGGEDHRTGQRDDADARYDRLEAWGRERFPMMGEVQFRWSGQVMQPIDDLAYIGHNILDADNVYIATGDAGMGMTHGAIAGMLLTDLICGRDSPWAKLYDPSRRTLRAAMTYAQGSANIAKQYAGWLTPGSSSEAQIAPGTGAVIRRGLTKVAVHRDEQGELHELSAVCAHLGCIVGWNSAEHTWDCPCHGSRYDSTGRVIHGPAIHDLHRHENKNT